MKAKILFADRRPMSEESMNLLNTVGSVVWADGDQETEPIEDLKDAVVVVSGLRMITRKAIFAAEKLKGIVVYGAGFDHVDIAAATDKKVYVANSPGANSVSVAEFAFGLMLGIGRNIPQLNDKTKAGKWLRFEMLGCELWHKTLGIVGLGRVGSHLAALGKGFEMRVISFTSHPSEERAERTGVKFVDLGTLLRKSDFLVLCCELTDETKGLIGEKEIDLMKPTAYLINVARGAVVNEHELTEALVGKRISGAALDVFEREPPDPNNPLLKLDNAILTSHMAGLSLESLKRLQLTVAEEAVRIIKGYKPRNLVNKGLFSSKE